MTSNSQRYVLEAMMMKAPMTPPPSQRSKSPSAQSAESSGPPGEKRRLFIRKLVWSWPSSSAWNVHPYHHTVTEADARTDGVLAAKGAPEDARSGNVIDGLTPNGGVSFCTAPIVIAPGVKPTSVWITNVSEAIGVIRFPSGTTAGASWGTSPGQGRGP